MKVVILGSGSWGTALAQVLADNHNDVTIWGINQEEVDDIAIYHHNHKYFETEINPDVKATMDLSIVKDADIVLLGVPSMAIESVAKQVDALLNRPCIFINVAKGFHPVTHERLSEVIKRSVSKEHLRAVVSLIGPSHAEEVIIRLLTSVNAVSEDKEAAILVQHTFSNDYFRVYTNTDVVGAEIGVALKNVMAIASGILTGLGQGDNARAALMTRGLAEITRYGVSHGANPTTYLGLDGVGDLIVTCTSYHSRNFMAGLEIGKADDATEFLKHNTKTVEGINAAKIVYEQAKLEGISMPITEATYKVLYENKKPSEVIGSLMKRNLKEEFEVN